MKENPLMKNFLILNTKNLSILGVNFMQSLEILP